MNKPDVKMIPYIIGNLKREIANATAKRQPVQIPIASGMTAGADSNYYVVDPVTGVVTLDIAVSFSTSSSYKNVNAEPLPEAIRPKRNLVFYLGGSAGSNLAETRCVIDTDGMIKLARTYNSTGRAEFAANTSAYVFTSISYIP